MQSDGDGRLPGIQRSFRKRWRHAFSTIIAVSESPVARGVVWAERTTATSR
jgi:hypothetical protein